MIVALYRRAIRTTSLPERLFAEERRRLGIIPDIRGEKPVPKSMSGAMMRASERRKSIRVTELELRQMKALRKEPDEEYRSRARPARAAETGTRPSNSSSKIRT